MDDSSQKKNSHAWIYVLVGLILVIVAVVAIILFLLQGKTTVNQGGEVEVTESISCTSDEVVYPFIKHDDAEKRSLKINAIFDNDKLQTVNLTYKMYYDDEAKIKQRSADNHADLNKSFGEDSLGADYFDAKFSILNDALQLSLYAEAKEIGGVSAKYFLIDGPASGLKKDKITKNYNEKGLDCVIHQ